MAASAASDSGTTRPSGRRQLFWPPAKMNVVYPVMLLDAVQTIDWTLRENVPAHLRVLVKRTLRK